MYGKYALETRRNCQESLTYACHLTISGKITGCDVLGLQKFESGTSLHSTHCEISRRQCCENKQEML